MMINKKHEKKILPPVPSGLWIKRGQHHMPVQQAAPSVATWNAGRDGEFGKACFQTGILIAFQLTAGTLEESSAKLIVWLLLHNFHDPWYEIWFTNS